MQWLADWELSTWIPPSLSSFWGEEQLDNIRLEPSEEMVHSQT